ncbi:MAG: hypothetical protein JZU65_00750 [Chlorobium sp.]|nr:hypothetical protein [Chlorobium sp.]
MRLTKLIDSKIDGGFAKMLESQLIDIELNYEKRNGDDCGVTIRCSAFIDGFKIIAMISSGRAFEIIDELLMNRFAVLSCGKRSFDLQNKYITWFILSKQKQS